MQVPKIYTAEEARRILKMGRTNFYDLLHQKKIKVLRNGRRYLIPESSILAFIETEVDGSNEKEADRKWLENI